MCEFAFAEYKSRISMQGENAPAQIVSTWLTVFSYLSADAARRLPTPVGPHSPCGKLRRLFFAPMTLREVLLNVLPCSPFHPLRCPGTRPAGSRSTTRTSPHHD